MKRTSDQAFNSDAEEDGRVYSIERLRAAEKAHLSLPISAENNHWLLLVAEYMENEFFTNLPDYLHWCGICRKTRTYYTAKKPIDLANEVEKKMVFHQKHESDSRDYTVRHQQVQLHNFVDFMKFNACLEIQLEGICLDLVKEDNESFGEDPRRRGYHLCRLHSLGSRIHPKRTQYFSTYAYQLFIWSTQWIKMRYGWDLVIADPGDFEDGLMDLSNLNDHELNDESNSDYSIFACCLKYHRQRDSKSKYWLY